MKIDYKYPNSIREADGSTMCLAIVDGAKSLIAKGKGGAYGRLAGFETVVDGESVKICAMDRANAEIIRDIFPFTKPVCFADKPLTIGLGDRLGLASPGHIRLIRDMDVFPVLAQQSVRELTLTQRTFDDVLDAASWAVFQEGYTKGFGADGDHLKTADEVKTALSCGFTMITLDCSEHIRNDAAVLDDDETDALYASLPDDARSAYESAYLNKVFDVGNEIISFSPRELKKIVLVYGDAIAHVRRIYYEIIIKNAAPVDFEASIDETRFVTTPAAHFFTAYELKRLGIKCVSVAPRFCGEFQKGIDYRGDIGQFESEFAIHDKIAKHFGYKLSVHSGSDKFKVFPIIRRVSGGVYHLKTAGTNWLEALRVIAEKAPLLFRNIAAFALANLREAKKYYITTENVSAIPDLATLADNELPSLFDNEDARQVLHITYGLVLSDKKDNGEPEFKDDIYRILAQYEDDYYEALIKHIGRHL